MLTSREMELFVALIRMAKKYHDSNPEVGMGPSLRMIAIREANKLPFKIDEADIDAALRKK